MILCIQDDLNLATQRIAGGFEGQNAAADNTVQLTGVYHNLLRQGAEMR